MDGKTIVGLNLDVHIERMRVMVNEFLTTHSREVEQLVDDELTRQFESGEFTKQIEASMTHCLRESLDSAVRLAVWDALKDGELRKLLVKRLTKAASKLGA